MSRAVVQSVWQESDVSSGAECVRAVQSVCQRTETTGDADSDEQSRPLCLRPLLCLAKEQLVVRVVRHHLLQARLANLLAIHGSARRGSPSAKPSLRKTSIGRI